MIEKLIEQINSDEIYCAIYIEDEIDLGEAKEIGIVDSDEHRWYVIGTVVFKLGDKFFGVQGPISLKSEEMGWEDTGCKCVAFEMEEVATVTYQKIRE